MYGELLEQSNMSGGFLCVAVWRQTRCKCDTKHIKLFAIDDIKMLQSHTKIDTHDRRYHTGGDGLFAIVLPYQLHNVRGRYLRKYHM